MRILVLAPGFPRPSDLFGTAVARFIQHLGRRHDLVIQAIRPPPVRTFLNDPLTVLGSGRGPKAVRGAYQSARLLRHHRRRPFHRVWALWPERTGWFAVGLARTFRCPLIVSLMGGEVAALQDPPYGALRARRTRVQLEVVFRTASHTTAGSEWLAHQAQLKFPKHTFQVAPLGVDVDKIPVRNEAPPGSAGPLRAVAVSNLFPVKRLHHAVEAIAHLRTQGIDASLDIFGLDPLPAIEAWRRQLAADGRAGFVQYRGALPYDTLCRQLCRYHVLVHPSAHEAQGMTMCEAAAARVPIAATPVGVAQTLKTQGAVVELVDDPRPQPLGHAIQRAATARSGRIEGVRAHFGLPATAAVFEQIFEAAGD